MAVIFKEKSETNGSCVFFLLLHETQTNFLSSCLNCNFSFLIMNHVSHELRILFSDVDVSHAFFFFDSKFAVRNVKIQIMTLNSPSALSFRIFKQN